MIFIQYAVGAGFPRPRDVEDAVPYNNIWKSCGKIKDSLEMQPTPICPYVRNEHTRGARGVPWSSCSNCDSFTPDSRLSGDPFFVWAFCFSADECPRALFNHLGSP